MSRSPRRPRRARRRRALGGFPPGSYLELVDQTLESLDVVRNALLRRPRDCAQAEAALDYAQSRIDKARAKGGDLPAQAKAVADWRADFVAACVWAPARPKRSRWWPLRGARQTG